MDRFCQSGVDGLWETWNGGYGQDRGCLCGGKVYKEVSQGTPLNGCSQGRVMGDLVCGSVPRSMHWSRTTWLLLVPSSLCYMLLDRFCNVNGPRFPHLWDICDSSNHLMRGFVSWTSWFMKSSQVYSKDCVWDTVLAVISTCDTWIAVWGHADSLKTSQMCLSLIYANRDSCLFSVAPPSTPSVGWWKSVGMCPSFF